MTSRFAMGIASTLVLGACGAPSPQEDATAERAGEPASRVFKGSSSAPVPPDDPAPVPTSGCVPGVPATPDLTRLSNREYDNTVTDLLGLTPPTYPELAPDSTAPVDAAAVQAYEAAAAALASQLVGAADARANVLPCDESTAACVASIAREFGGRAWRRPLSDSEIADLVVLYDSRDDLTENGSYDEALELIVRTLLSSPSFYHRVETSREMEGSYYVLNSYEIASRLSFMLWESMPDAALFDAAAAGGLTKPEAILEQAYRMLQSPRAHGMVAAFHERYAAMGPGSVWQSYDRDPDKYPRFSPELPAVLAEETARVFEMVFFGGGSFQDLLLSSLGYVNATSAPVYDLDPSQFGDDLVSVELVGRPGVFTRAGFLASHAHYGATSPIARGGFVLRRVLCLDVGPAHAEEVMSQYDPNLATQRERVEALTQAAQCIGCHTLMDPHGFALEGFDAIGAVQAFDDGTPVDTKAYVVVGSNTAVDVDGAIELMTTLADSPQAQRCYATWWVEHAYDRHVTPSDLCVVDALAAMMTQGQGAYTLLDLVAALTQADSFRLRVPTDAAPASPSGPPSGVQADVPPAQTSTGTSSTQGGSGGQAAGEGGSGATTNGPAAGRDGRGAGGVEGDVDGGVEPGPRGSRDGATGLQSLSSKPSSGCGCRVADTTHRRGPLAPLVLALLGASVVLRRRRAPSGR